MTQFHWETINTTCENICWAAETRQTSNRLSRVKVPANSNPLKSHTTARGAIACWQSQKGSGYRYKYFNLQAWPIPACSLQTNPQSESYVTIAYVPTIPLCSKIWFRNHKLLTLQKANVEDQAFSCYVSLLVFARDTESWRRIPEKTKARSTIVLCPKLLSRLMVISECL